VHGEGFTDIPVLWFGATTLRSWIIPGIHHPGALRRCVGIVATVVAPAALMPVLGRPPAIVPRGFTWPEGLHLALSASLARSGAFSLVWRAWMAASANRQRRRSVLLFLADDLSLPRLSPTLTPAIARLASSPGAVHFTRHYTAQPSCSPARTALLTSRRPDATRVYDLFMYWRERAETNVTSLPEFFKRRGYSTVGIGKVYHPNHASGSLDASAPGGPREDQDGALSWSEPFWRVPDASLALECGATWSAGRCVGSRTSWRVIRNAYGAAAHTCIRALFLSPRLDRTRLTPAARTVHALCTASVPSPHCGVCPLSLSLVGQV
jgi:hypothetical protein